MKYIQAGKCRNMNCIKWHHRVCSYWLGKGCRGAPERNTVSTFIRMWEWSTLSCLLCRPLLLTKKVRYCWQKGKIRQNITKNYTTGKVSNNKIIDSDSVIYFALLKLSDTEDVEEEIAGKT